MSERAHTARLLIACPDRPGFVAAVSHGHSVPDLVRVGRGIERAVLAQAVAAHLEDRILIHGNKTVVFT